MRANTNIQANLCRFIISVVAVFFAFPLYGGEQTAFEVASLKQTEKCDLHVSVDPGIVTFIGVPLKLVIATAFNVKMSQVSGPSWLDSDCFDITGKMPTGASKEDMPQMLRALLVDRFSLKARDERRATSGYALVVDQAGAKLKESPPITNAVRSRAGQVAFGASPEMGSIQGSMTMSTFARLLSSRLGSPVQDQTGMTAKYDVDIAWTPDRTIEKIGSYAETGAAQSTPADAASVPTGLDNIFGVLRESLGLRLISGKQQAELVIVDSIDRVPSKN